MIEGWVDLKSVPPPTRGWSLGIDPLDRRYSGSPAHAGMVPTSGARLRLTAWFPRPRGDGPYERDRGQIRDPVPPPTRGWSPVKPVDRAFPAGSPAHAGMVP